MSYNHTMITTTSISVCFESSELNFVLDKLGLEHPKYNAVQQYLTTNEEVEVDVSCEVELGSNSGAELLDVQEMNIFGCAVESTLLPLIELKIYDRLSDEEFESAWGW